jgi:KDO2-lipid IV(A) lauroyltransferase
LQYIVYLLAKGFVEFIRLLPLKVAFFLATAMGILAYYLDFFGRNLMIHNLLHVGMANNKLEAAVIARKNYVHLLKFGIEFLKFDQYITAENITKYIKFKSTPKADEAIKNAKGIIFVSGHYGNWEISGLFCSAVLRPLLSVMKPSPNQRITDYLINKRKKFGQELCMKKDSFRLLLSSLKSGKSVGLIADQDARSKGIDTVFLAHLARTHMSPALLHLKTGAPIIAGVARRLDDKFNYEVVIEDPITLEKSTGNTPEDIKILAQQYIKVIENAIRKDPTQWMWYNTRWRKSIKKKKIRLSAKTKSFKI